MKKKTARKELEEIGCCNFFVDEKKDQEREKERAN
jgi:hypothetical protein